MSDVHVETVSSAEQVGNSLAQRLVRHACNADHHAVGFLPYGAVSEAIQEQRMLRLYRNNDCVGYLIWRVRLGEMRVVQVWVREDARQIMHGKILVARAEQIARRRGCYRMRAWVAEDLAANIFWAAIGFKNSTWRWSPRRGSKRRHLLWLRCVASATAYNLG